MPDSGVPDSGVSFPYFLPLISSEIPSLIDSPSPWHDWYNAAVYQSFIEDFPIYRWLNRQLARTARLRGATRIFDLACGTGATAAACLPEMDRDAELVGLDSSEPMVELARAEISDARCSFQVGDARHLRHHLDGHFDRAICNAAFWQLPEPTKVLAELARVLEPGALFTFSIPSQYLAPETVDAHPFQLAVARHLDASSIPRRPPRGPFTSVDGLAEVLEAGGFRPELIIEARYFGRQQELVDLMHIPAMACSIAEGLPEADCRTVIAKAAAEIDPEEDVTVPWTLVRAVL